MLRLTTNIETMTLGELSQVLYDKLVILQSDSITAYDSFQSLLDHLIISIMENINLADVSQEWLAQLNVSQIENMTLRDIMQSERWSFQPDSPSIVMLSDGRLALRINKNFYLIL
jgi:hypothetical protein